MVNLTRALATILNVTKQILNHFVNAAPLHEFMTPQEPDWVVTPFHLHVERVLAAITEPPCDSSKGALLASRTSFVRDGNVIRAIRAS